MASSYDFDKEKYFCFSCFSALPILTMKISMLQVYGDEITLLIAFSLKQTVSNGFIQIQVLHCHQQLKSYNFLYSLFQQLHAEPIFST
jgi:hypothetical protein